MGIHYAAGYALPAPDLPLTHARIAHAGNWRKWGMVSVSDTAAGYFATGPAGLNTREPWMANGNLLNNSRDFESSDWIKTGVTVEGGGVSEDSSNGPHEIGRSHTFQDADMVLSFDVAPEFRDEIRIVANDGATDFASYFDLGTQQAGTTQNCQARILEIEDYLRCEIRFTPVSGAGSIALQLSDRPEDTDYLGDGTSGIFVREAFLGLTDSHWEIDFRSPKESDYCAIAGHNFGTAGVTLDLQYFDTTWQSVMQVVPDDDSAIWMMFAPVNAARWRLVISGGRAARMANQKIGKALQVPDRIYQDMSPITLSKDVTFRTQRSETGEFLDRTIQRRSLLTELTWDKLPKAWVDQHWGEVQEALGEAPFFVIWRPETHDECALMSCEALPVPVHSGPRDYMSATISAVGLAHG